MAVAMKTTSKNLCLIASVFQPKYFSNAPSLITYSASPYYQRIQWHWTKLLFSNKLRLIDVRGKQTASSELKLLAKPKLPANPFMLFLMKEMPNYPDMKNNERVSFIAKKYREISEEEKDLYRQEFDEKLEIFRKNLAIYKESLTPDEKEQIIRMRKEKQIKKKVLKEAKETKIELKNLGKPKSIGSSFSLFVADYSEKHGIRFDVSAATKKWKELSEIDKAKYKKLFLQRQEKHEIDLLAWEKRMSEMGRNDLIRVKSTIKQTKQ